MISSALALATPSDVRLKGPGFAGMVRLAHSDEHLWAEILAANGDMISAGAADFLSTLEALLAAVTAGDREMIAAIMARARAAIE